MKTAKKWVDEHSQSGPFDLIEHTSEAEALVREIQQDAQALPPVEFANGLPPTVKEIANWHDWAAVEMPDLDAGRDLTLEAKRQIHQLIAFHRKAARVLHELANSQVR